MTVKITQFAYDEEWHRRKIAIKKTWREVMEAGIISFEMGIIPEEKEKEEEIPEEDETVGLQLTKPISVSKREIDVFRNDQWRKSPFDEIDIGSIFRIRDDDRVMIIDGYKKFEKRGAMFEQNGLEWVYVLPIKTKINEAVHA